MNKSYKKFLAASVAGMIATSVAAPILPVNVLSADAASTGFKDVYKENYFYEAVANLTQRGVIKGFDDNTYRPNEEVTRAQAAAIIAASLGLNTKIAKDPGFKDVKASVWYHGAVAALVEKKIMSGIDSNTFLPNKPVTRGEMAKMLSLAYNLKSSASKTAFTDVPEKSWFASFVGGLVENKVTSGIDAKTFAPGQTVTRGQMAAFVYRAEKAAAATLKVEKVSASTVTVSGKTYNLSDSVKSIFSPANETALKNALVRFEESKGSITKVTYLEIAASGTSAGDVVFDGNNAVIDGSVKINGDYVTVKNLTVKDSFELAAGVQKSFYSSHLTVAGKTVIGAAAAVKASSSDTTFYKGLTQKVSVASMKAAAEAKSGKIVFDNANLKSVDVNKRDVLVESKGSSTIGEITLTSNAAINAADGVVIPKITVSAGAEAVEINAKVTELAVNSTKPLTLSGNATIDNVKIQQSSAVSLNTTGEIKQIQSENKDAKLTISETAKVGNIEVPAGTNVSEVITNYEEVKENIQNVGGQTNPDAVQPTPPPSTVPAPPPVNEEDVKAVAAAKAALVEASLLNGNESLAAVTADLTLPAAGAEGTVINWNSSNPQVLAADGKVTQPAYAAGDATVTLTATITKNGVSETKSFTVVVKKKAQTDAEAVDAAKAALVAAEFLNVNQGLNAVTGDLIFPGAGIDGTTITWASSNTSVVSAEGKVTRPAYTESDAEVTLTATISKNGVSDTKTFAVVVKKMVQTDAEAVAAAKTGLVGATLLNGNESLEAVSGDLTLPVNGMDGTSISWSSSNPQVVAADGKVTQPAYTETDAEVTLTATITKNGVSDTKTFAVIVKKKVQTDAEAVAADLASLVEATILHNNGSLDNVTGELALPLEGINGTTISWNSSNNDVVTEGGIVNRPAHTEEDVEVTLTATINKNAASATKAFTVIVKKEDQPAEPVVKTMELYTGIDAMLSKFELFPTNPDIYMLNITKVESSDPAILTASVHNVENINLSPVKIGSVTLTITFSNGETAELPVTVSNLDMTLAGLNSLVLDPTQSNKYKTTAARKIIESLLTPAANSDYAMAQDHLKDTMMYWVLKKKPGTGFATLNELTSTFDLVVTTLSELEKEYKKYMYEIDLLSNLSVDENGNAVARDVTSKFLYDPMNQIDPAIKRKFNIYNQEYLTVDLEGNFKQIKNNTSASPIRETFFYDLEKNGITRTGQMTVTIVPQSSSITAPVLSITGMQDNTMYVTKPMQKLELQVHTPYQLDEITAVQDGKAVPVNFVRRGYYGAPFVYNVTLDEVQGENQELKITAKIGNEVSEKSITLVDAASPMIYSVKKDSTNDKFIVTFTEPVVPGIQGLDLKSLFKVSQGEIVSVDQVNNTTFDVAVSNIEADYLEVTAAGKLNEAVGGKLYTDKDVFIFNNTAALLNAYLEKGSYGTGLNVSGDRPRNGIYIVSDDEFSFESSERPETNTGIELLTGSLNGTPEENLASIDHFMKQINKNQKLIYLGVEGYSENHTLDILNLENGDTAVIGKKHIHTFLKYETPSGDVVYSQKYFASTFGVDKTKALSVIDQLFSHIPADLTLYHESELLSYKEELDNQISLLRTWSISEAELQGLAHHNQYQALVDYINSL